MFSEEGAVLGQAGCQLIWEYGQLITDRAGWATPRRQSCLWDSQAMGLRNHLKELGLNWAVSDQETLHQ